MTRIEYNQVTWYSKLVAVALFVGVFAFAFYLGREFGIATEGIRQISNASVVGILNEVTYSCKNNRMIQARFRPRIVHITLSDGRSISLTQTVSASGARYANLNESLIFWNKGNTAFIQEGSKTTYQDCTEQ